MYGGVASGRVAAHDCGLRRLCEARARRDVAMARRRAGGHPGARGWAPRHRERAQRRGAQWLRSANPTGSSTDREATGSDCAEPCLAGHRADLDRAADAALEYVKNGLDAAMNKFNGGVKE